MAAVAGHSASLDEKCEKVQENSYDIILFYKYVSIENPDAEMERQVELCSNLGLTGRVLVSAEGINGTLSSAVGRLSDYMSSNESVEYLQGIQYKESVGPIEPFPDLKIKGPFGTCFSTP
jgi:UPF0176 protein